MIQLDPAGWMPRCFVNRLNNRLVMIIENLKKLAQACPIDGDGGGNMFDYIVQTGEKKRGSILIVINTNYMIPSLPSLSLILKLKD